MMLIVPYTFYATKGIMIICDKISTKPRKALLAATIIVYTSIAIPYLASSSTNPISLYSVLWPSTKYSPPTMLRLGTPLEDVPSVEQALKWLNTSMEEDSCLITRETFTNWAQIYLKNDATIISYGEKDVSIGLQYAEALNYTKIYWIWWKNGTVAGTWYGQTVPNEFKPIYEAGNISIYAYNNQ